MPLLQSIEEPTAAGLRPQWRAFLEMGFRPLYLLGCGWAALSVALWIFTPHWLQGRLAGVVWHAHEMLWAFVATIAVGFLLTAGTNWTGINPLKGRALGALCGLWIAARVAFLVPGEAAFIVGAVCELLFFAWASIVLGMAVFKARSQRNYGIPFMLAGLGLADGLYLLAAARGEYATLMQHFHSGVLVMCVLTLLIARRVIPFFASRAVQGFDIPMHARSGQWQLSAGVLAILCSLLQWRAPQAGALAVAGGIALWQVLAWKPHAVLRKPLLWILYLGYAMLALGLLVAATHALGWGRPAIATHLIGIGGFALLIIGMATRTALGHLGRALQTDRSMVTSYVFVALALVLRMLALLPSPFTLPLLHASACAWLLAFALYLWRFAPMMIRPRPDQAGGMPVRRAPPKV